MTAACEAALASADLVELVLSSAHLDPVMFVCAGLVSKTWRDVCRNSIGLLTAAVRKPRYLTKAEFSGLLGLRGKEADAFPREEIGRSPGRCVYMYTAAAIDAALPCIGGLAGWRARLARRAKRQASLEQAFGPDWRELQFIAYAAPEANASAKRSRRRLVY